VLDVLLDVSFAAQLGSRATQNSFHCRSSQTTSRTATTGCSPFPSAP